MVPESYIQVFSDIPSLEKRETFFLKEIIGIDFED